jgi:adenosylcobinamide-GDP ribazoletransferase
VSTAALEARASPLRRAADGLRLASIFLTVVPVRVRDGADSTWMPAWFPVVGALVGGLASVPRLVLDGPLGPAPATVLALATLALLTGALHLDGLADCADGLGARGGRERRLAVMREPQVGVFGVLALLLWLLLVVTALSGLGSGDALRALVLACALGRWSALAHALLAPAARADGLGAAFDVGRAPFAIASLAAGGLAFVIEAPLPAASALALAAVVALATSAWARRSIGGRTGDTLGASVTLVEAAVCLVVLGFAGS